MVFEVRADPICGCEITTHDAPVRKQILHRLGDGLSGIGGSPRTTEKFLCVHFRRSSGSISLTSGQIQKALPNLVKKFSGRHNFPSQPAVERAASRRFNGGARWSRVSAPVLQANSTLLIDGGSVI